MDKEHCEGCSYYYVTLYTLATPDKQFTPSCTANKSFTPISEIETCTIKATRIFTPIRFELDMPVPEPLGITLMGLNLIKIKGIDKKMKFVEKVKDFFSTKESDPFEDIRKDLLSLKKSKEIQEKRLATTNERITILKSKLKELIDEI
jgi:hypothetical protein